MQGFLGWDVGAWHCDKGASRDALVLLAGDRGPLRVVGRPWRGNLRASFNGRTGFDLLDELLRLAGGQAEPFTSITLAIDTPLGWPDAFCQLLGGHALSAVPDSKATNPLLMRSAEQWLARRAHVFTGENKSRTPLSAVQDLIGSQSTKGLAFLAALGVQSKGVGVWDGQVGAVHLTAVEAYPAPCVRSAFMQDALASVADCPASMNYDVRDALTCALVAWAFATHPDRLAPPPTETPLREGWIWVPRDCLIEEEETLA